MRDGEGHYFRVTALEPVTELQACVRERSGGDGEASGVFGDGAGDASE